MPPKTAAPHVPIAEDSSQSEFSFSCHCGRKWHETWPIPIHVEALARRLKYLSCPKCDGKNIAFIVPLDEPEE